MTIDTEINAKLPAVKANFKAMREAADAMQATITALQASPQMDEKNRVICNGVLRELEGVKTALNKLKGALMAVPGFGAGDTPRGD